MNINLKSMTVKELEKLKTSVERELSRKIDREKKAALAAAQKAAKEHGFDLSEITVGDAKPTKRAKPQQKKKVGAPSPPKYRHPDNPAVTWTGKGRQPKWIIEAEAAG